MRPIVDVLVTLLQVGLFAFLLWGASLCLRDLLGRPREMRDVASAQQAGFERVASLVLLALLCTTLAGLA